MLTLLNILFSSYLYYWQRPLLLYVQQGFPNRPMDFIIRVIVDNECFNQDIIYFQIQEDFRLAKTPPKSIQFSSKSFNPLSPSTLFHILLHDRPVSFFAVPLSFRVTHACLTFLFFNHARAIISSTFSHNNTIPGVLYTLMCSPFFFTP